MALSRIAWWEAIGRGTTQTGARAIVESARARLCAGGGKRTTAAGQAAHLALRDVLHVRGEGAEHPFGVRALIRVVAVVQDVAQLLELSQGLRHGAAPARISTRSPKNLFADRRLLLGVSDDETTLTRSNAIPEVS